jgi:hypothetical protein
MDDQHASRPRMPHDNPLAMMEFLGVFWRYPGTMLPCALQHKRNLPGQTLQGLPRFGPWLGLLLRQGFSRRERHLRRGLQKRAALGCVEARKARGFFTRVLPRDAHQKEPRTHADLCETCADRATAPTQVGKGWGGLAAPPLCERGDMSGDTHWTGTRGGMSTPSCHRRQGWEKRESLPVIQKRRGSAWSNDARARRGYATGR